MPTVNVSISASGLGANINQSFPRTAEGGSSIEVAMPAGKPGNITTRTDDDTGILTVASGHGITTADRVDVYWSGGLRSDMFVTGTGATTIDIEGGTGDVLPADESAIVVTKRVEISAAIDGDNLVFLAIAMVFADPSITSDSHADFWQSWPAEESSDSAGGELTDMDLGENEPQIFDVQGGATNPFTGNPITTIHASNGSGTTAATLKLIWLQDPTP